MALVRDVYCDFVTFPVGILGQVWYLIVPIPDICCLSHFDAEFYILLCRIGNADLTYLMYLTSSPFNLTYSLLNQRDRMDDDRTYILFDRIENVYLTYPTYNLAPLIQPTDCSKSELWSKGLLISPILLTGLLFSFPTSHCLN